MGSVGVHFDRTTTFYRDKENRLVQQEAHGVGVHAGVQGVDVSLTMQSGFEASSASKTTDPNGVITETWWERKFNGELTLSLTIGRRHGSWRVMPAFSYHKVTYVHVYREDGGHRKSPYAIFER